MIKEEEPHLCYYIVVENYYSWTLSSFSKSSLPRSCVMGWREQLIPDSPLHSHNNTEERKSKSCQLCVPEHSEKCKRGKELSLFYPPPSLLKSLPPPATLQPPSTQFHVQGGPGHGEENLSTNGDEDDKGLSLCHSYHLPVSILCEGSFSSNNIYVLSKFRQ